MRRWPIDRVETRNKAGGVEWEWHGLKAQIPRLVTAGEARTVKGECERGCDYVKRPSGQCGAGHREFASGCVPSKGRRWLGGGPSRCCQIYIQSYYNTGEKKWT